MTLIHSDDWLTVHQGDCRVVMAEMEPESVHCVVTSPPYWGLRDYGDPGQLGLEPTPEAYVASMVEVFREVKRVLRSDGTVWLNLGDTYRDKDLVGIPWRVAFALQADGWYLRSDIIWSKPNPMPESVTDRPTKSHEYLFLLSKRATYYFDSEAVSEPGSPTSHGGTPTHAGPKMQALRRDAGVLGVTAGLSRNIRSVWTVATQPYPGAHFATFPEALIEPCIKAGSPQLGVVLDPFAGSGTTGRVAQRLGRRAVLIDLSADYLTQAMTRNQDIPLGLETA